MEYGVCDPSCVPFAVKIVGCIWNSRITHGYISSWGNAALRQAQGERIGFLVRPELVEGRVRPKTEMDPSLTMGLTTSRSREIITGQSGAW
jgi:hypothetical protein